MSITEQQLSQKDWTIESSRSFSSSSRVEEFKEIVLVDLQMASNPIPRESFGIKQDRKESSVSGKKRTMIRSGYRRDALK